MKIKTWWGDSGRRHFIDTELKRYLDIRLEKLERSYLEEDATDMMLLLRCYDLQGWNVEEYHTRLRVLNYRHEKGFI